MFGYAQAEGDALDFRGSGLASVADLAVFSDGTNLALIAANGSRVDVYGLSALSQVTVLF